jgi:hypothetical protein
MIETAVAGHDRITVLATVRSTIAPTMDFLADVARRAGRRVTARSRLVDGAWDAFEAGDPDTCAELIADAVNAIDDDSALVLAQVSMADAARRCDASRRVFTSPLSGFLAAARICLGESPGERSGAPENP